MIWGREPDSPVFAVLDSLFADVDDYVADDDLRERAGGLSAEQLRASTQAALDALSPRPRSIERGVPTSVR